jgi:hypothetical protein
MRVLLVEGSKPLPKSKIKIKLGQQPLLKV